MSAATEGTLPPSDREVLEHISSKLDRVERTLRDALPEIKHANRTEAIRAARRAKSLRVRESSRRAAARRF